MASRTVELIGPAGAGKSTLAQALPTGDRRITSGFSVWGLPKQMLAASALSLAPMALGRLFARRPLRWPELAQMIRLRTLHRLIERTRRRGDGLLVLDEGPVFAFAWLTVFHPATGDAVRSAWRRAMLREWSRSLDAIVWLDAGDQELVRRIRERAKPHPVKHDPDAAIIDFTERFRSAFDRVITDIAELNGVRVLRAHANDLPPAHDVGTWRSTLEEFVRGN